ncbi:MAG: hypothetical protein KF841_12620 [Phycisphaerae bacterium]|nr:hypothetical protein [Phycisphaerae bacterium]
MIDGSGIAIRLLAGTGLLAAAFGLASDHIHSFSDRTHSHGTTIATPGHVEGTLPAPPTSEPADGGGEATGAGDDSATGPDKALTYAQVSRIRYMELRGMRKPSMTEPDRVTVRISRDVIDEFLLSMEGDPNFREDRDRRNFLKMTPPQKLHTIAKYKGAAYADKVRITSDPEVFVEFRKNVLPHVLRGCATTGCHTSTNRSAPGFAFLNDPKRTTLSVYSNFLILNDLRVDKRRMIDRSQPENSLILTYLLPRNAVLPEYRHPGTADIKPLFPSRKHKLYTRILAWIASLKHPSEDYGVRLIETTTMPSDDDGGDADATEPADSN